MAAAYATLLSLKSVIEQIQHHPRPPISFDKLHIESLSQKVVFLKEFLEVHPQESEGLESRIADAAYAAEDIIESHVVDQILGEFTSHGHDIRSTHHFCHFLVKVIVDMDFIMREAVEIQKKTAIRDHLAIRSIPAGALGHSSSSTRQKNTMVGFEDVSIEIMDKLTGCQFSGWIIPIVGMGGIGKTTIATNVYESPVIVEHFDIRAWATISQLYNVRKILLQLLLLEIKENLDGLSEEELGERLYKSLFGRRYLIVLDDVWSVEIWNEIKRFLPNSNSESRMMITTRLSNLASQLPGSIVVEMNFLDDDRSWNLLCKNVFGEDGDCPAELEKIGRKIAKSCKGLPLSLVVIGGLLAKSEQTQENWEYISKNLSSNLEEDELCLKVLYTSYNQLPVHLKPCFLYMGAFSEGEVVRVSWLIKLWASEGFLKPIINRSLEEAGEEYFKELVERNLILVHKRGCTGNIKFCKIHDLLRDLCVREAEKSKFLKVTSLNTPTIPPSINIARRIAIQRSTSTWLKEKVNVRHQSDLRSLLICGFAGDLASLEFRLLRVFKTVDKIPRVPLITEATCSVEDLFQLVNLRFLAPAISASEFKKFPSSVIRLWNLHTIICEGVRTTAPPELWKMPQLRHVQFGVLHLPDPPQSGHEMDDDVVLGSLQTLSYIVGFSWVEEVVRIIPNIKKLKISCGTFSKEDGAVLSFNALAHMHKLESLSCSFGYEARWNNAVQNLIFPHSLKKLDFAGNQLHWENVADKIGSLPCLEKLSLKNIKGDEWTPVEGQFEHLKFLKLDECESLEYWMADSSHFPRLEQLVLHKIYRMEIPSSIGDIPSLQSIELVYCGKNVAFSAKKILEEQEELGNSVLQVRLRIDARKNQPQFFNMKKITEDSLETLFRQRWKIPGDDIYPFFGDQYRESLI